MIAEFRSVRLLHEFGTAIDQCNLCGCIVEAIEGRSYLTDRIAMELTKEFDWMNEAFANTILQIVQASNNNRHHFQYHGMHM